MSRLPTYYVSHGGGPWPWMREQTGGRYDRLEASLQAMAQAHQGQVRAILMVTAHWETPDFTLSSSAQPGMLYDYYGFPPHTYQVHYRAPGSPELAQRALELLQAGGVTARLDPERGFDHGTFSALQAAYPEAQIPVVQLSVLKSFDPAALGRPGALKVLRSKRIADPTSARRARGTWAFRFLPYCPGGSAACRTASGCSPCPHGAGNPFWSNP